MLFCSSLLFKCWNHVVLLSFLLERNLQTLDSLSSLKLQYIMLSHWFYWVRYFNLNKEVGMVLNVCNGAPTWWTTLVLNSLIIIASATPPKYGFWTWGTWTFHSYTHDIYLFPITEWLWDWLSWETSLWKNKKIWVRSLSAALFLEARMLRLFFDWYLKDVANNAWRSTSTFSRI